MELDAAVGHGSVGSELVPSEIRVSLMKFSAVIELDQNCCVAESEATGLAGQCIICHWM